MKLNSLLSAALFALDLFLFLFWSKYYKYYYKLEHKKNNLIKDKYNVASNSLTKFYKNIAFHHRFSLQLAMARG